MQLAALGVGAYFRGDTTLRQAMHMSLRHFLSAGPMSMQRSWTEEGPVRLKHWGTSTGHPTTPGHPHRGQALYVAAQEGKSEVVQTLIGAGAEVNHVDTVLMTACWWWGRAERLENAGQTRDDGMAHLQTEMCAQHAKA